MELKYLLILCIIFFFGISASLGQNCSEHHTCFHCTDQTGCGWCGPTLSCMPGNSSGPSNGTCKGRAWQFESCFSCSRLKDCKQCWDRDSECYWCKELNMCVPYEFAPHCPVPSTRNCNCGDFMSCSDCTGQPACSWCDDPNNPVCVNTFLGQCLGAKTRECSCELNRDCFSCKEDSMANCVWCENFGFCMRYPGAQNCGPSYRNTSCNSYCRNGAYDCNSCESLRNCVWCGREQMCVDQADSDCFPNSCLTCGNFPYCSSCLSEPDCVWCDVSATCVNRHGAVDNCPFISHSCQAYCSTFQNCESCNRVTGCGWCADTGSCRDTSTDNSGCLYSHICGALVCEFSGGTFAGGIFLILGIVAIAGLAIWLYRWRSSKQVMYSELK